MRENSQRDTFIFYRSFKESMNELSDADKLIMYEAISDYSLDMKEPELTGFPKALFSIILQNVAYLFPYRMFLEIILPIFLQSIGFYGKEKEDITDAISSFDYL